MSFGEAFLQLMIWVPLIMLWAFALFDLFRTDMSGLAKVLWALAIVAVPVFGVILYFWLRPIRDNQYQVEGPGQTGPEDDAIDSIARLHDLNQRGILDDAEYLQFKTMLVR